MTRFGWIAAAFGAYALTVVANARANDFIVPGQSIGPVALGTTASQLYSILGDPKNTDVREEVTTYTFDGLQVSVENNDQVVDQIVTTSPKYKLASGVSVGSSALALVAAYGEPQERAETTTGDKTFCYYNFEAYVRTGSIFAIEVSRAGCQSGFLYYLR